MLTPYFASTDILHILRIRHKKRGPTFFFFNDTATTEIYTLSLHDALPISVACKGYCRECLACILRTGFRRVRCGVSERNRKRNRGRRDQRAEAVLAAVRSKRGGRSY